MDKNTLISSMDFSRSRLSSLLDTIEKSGQPVSQVLAWRPGAGRAHIGWQAMHCAATHDRYLFATILGRPVQDEALVAGFAYGSKPSDENVPTLSDIRAKLESNYRALRDYVAGLDDDGLARKIPGPGGTQRSIAEAIQLLTWHEAHHQGQIHLTWNLYKAAHGIAT